MNPTAPDAPVPTCPCGEPLTKVGCPVCMVCWACADWSIKNKWLYGNKVQGRSQLLTYARNRKTLNIQPNNGAPLC